MKIPNRYGTTTPRKVAKKRKSSARRKYKASQQRTRHVASRHKKINRHTVRSGENLTLIARKYDVTVQQLRKWNRIGRRYVLKPGKRLKVATSGRVHIVRRGENLNSIAKRYSVPVRKLAIANEIANRSLINIGTSLVIPE